MAILDGRKSKRPQPVPLVEPWKPEELTEGILDVANRRTRDITYEISRQSWSVSQAQRIAISCYLQGFNDAVNVVIGPPQ